MKQNDNCDSRQSKVKNTGKMSEKEIDDNLEESFPASDPPSWTLGSNHRAETEQEAEKMSVKKIKSG